MTSADERESSQAFSMPAKESKEFKEFKEAGKERLTRDTVRDATRQEIEHLKRENHDGRTTREEPRGKNHEGRTTREEPGSEATG